MKKISNFIPDKVIKKKETIDNNSKTRKKREELSINASKSIKKEEVEIIVEFK